VTNFRFVPQICGGVIMILLKIKLFYRCVLCSIPRLFNIYISVYANIYFKTILRECLRAGLPPGFPSTAPPPVCVSAVLGRLTVWKPHQEKKNPPVWSKERAC